MCIIPRFSGLDVTPGSVSYTHLDVYKRQAQVLGHLSYSLGQYKEALTKFAERLNEPDYDRTQDGYAAMFGQFFKGEPTPVSYTHLDVYKRQEICRWKR